MPLLNGIEHIYWTLDLEGEVHSIWDLWINGLKKCKAMVFPKLDGRTKVFGRVQKNWISLWAVAPGRIYLPQKSLWGMFNEVHCEAFKHGGK
jgi:hypothetical protein